MAVLYGRAGRVTAENGGSRPGQWLLPNALALIIASIAIHAANVHIRTHTAHCDEDRCAPSHSSQLTQLTAHTAHTAHCDEDSLDSLEDHMRAIGAFMIIDTVRATRGAVTCPSHFP